MLGGLGHGDRQSKGNTGINALHKPYFKDVFFASGRLLLILGFAQPDIFFASGRLLLILGFALPDVHYKH